MADPRTGEDLGRRFERLARVVADLRTHCPWTRALDHRALLEYLIEEAYEVVEQVEAGAVGPDDAAAFSGELADVLLQVMLHARLQEEAGHFGIGDVLDALTEKMLRRNPHVFAPDGSLRRDIPQDPAEIERAWDQAKRAEAPERTVFDGIPASLPALLLAAKAQSRARRAGHEVPARVLPSGPGALPGTDAGAHRWAGEEELGEALFEIVRSAGEQGLDAEAALRAAVGRFMDGR